MLTTAEAEELARLEATFEELGGRGVDLAERIDELRAKKDEPMSPLPAVEVTSEMLAASYEKYSAALADTVVLSLRAIGEITRTHYPAAASVLFVWSDQGDFLSLAGILDAEGTTIEQDDLGDHVETLDWNLGENCKSAWEPYMVDADNDGPIRRRTNEMRMAIEPVLAIPIPEAYLPAPEVIVEIDDEGDAEMTCPKCGSHDVREVNTAVAWQSGEVTVDEDNGVDTIVFEWDGDNARGTDFDGDGYICASCTTKLDIPDVIHGRAVEHNYS